MTAMMMIEEASSATEDNFELFVYIGAHSIDQDQEGEKRGMVRALGKLPPLAGWLALVDHYRTFGSGGAAAD